MNNVRNFGAAGDGVTSDTAAVQNAVNAGGITFFPPGTYLCGTLYLKDFSTLELAPGAVLLATPERNEYNPDDFAPDNHIYETEAVSGAHFLIADGCRNITIRGGGRIDGNRAGFYELPQDELCSYDTITWRPAQMIFFRRCRNVTLENVELTNSPYWSCFLYDCESVIVHALRITNPMATPNGDGLDLDCCRKVTVSDCIIETGDDCIAIRSCADHGAKNPVCENITVTNCILTTVCNAVRFGVGTGVIRNVLFNNCSIVGSRTGFCLAVQYWQNASLQIEDCIFSNLRIEAKRPFSIHSNAWGRTTGAVTKRIENLLFCNIRSTVSAGAMIDAFAPGDIRDLTFDNVELCWTGKAPEAEFETPDYDYTERTDHAPRAAWYIRNGENIQFRNCTVKNTQPEGIEDFMRVGSADTVPAANRM